MSVFLNGEFIVGIHGYLGSGLTQPSDKTFYRMCLFLSHSAVEGCQKNTLSELVDKGGMKKTEKIEFVRHMTKEHCKPE